ncbi:Acb2/Tad1 domain-containing protein [Acidiphilium angustum]|uniref:Acb2/Tad1 domain-containing protein n=1 Tax=Acidiphilium angustum TaxID=523 RepID=UPI00049462F4|nr:hypothetical protein [Acidiphilium angustum]
MTEDEFRSGPTVAAPNYPNPELKAVAHGQHVAADGAAMAVPIDNFRMRDDGIPSGYQPRGAGADPLVPPTGGSSAMRPADQSIQAQQSQTQAQHVFTGEPDARQSDRVDHKVSRFRPTYRALTPEQKALHDRIKELAAVLEDAIEHTPPGRYQSLAMTALEEAIMWAVKGLTQ